jgi:hypothetical protein
MKSEKIPLAIAMSCGGIAVVLFMFQLNSLAGVLGLVAIVAGFFYAEAKWHNIRQTEVESLKEALRQCQTQLPPEGGQGAEKKEGQPPSDTQA